MSEAWLILPGLILLVAGGEWLVRGASRLAAVAWHTHPQGIEPLMTNDLYHGKWRVNPTHYSFKVPIETDGWTTDATGA